MVPNLYQMFPSKLMFSLPKLLFFFISSPSPLFVSTILILSFCKAQYNNNVMIIIILTELFLNVNHCSKHLINYLLLIYI